MALTLTQKGSIATLFLTECGYTVNELKEMFYREVITMDKKNIEGLVSASHHFARLSADDKKFIVLLNKVYTPDDLLNRIESTVNGTYKDRLERCAQEVGIL